MNRESALMEILKISASHNLLAFALVVDIFERSSYVGRDPLASLLESGGFKNSAQQIDIHKGINDSGSHENISLQFLEYMSRTVSPPYAIEALRFAELTTALEQSVSTEVGGRAPVNSLIVKGRSSRLKIRPVNDSRTASRLVKRIEPLRMY